MATVRASCPTCGDIETTTRAMTLLRCTSTGSASYAFPCPLCAFRVTKEATERVVGLLVDAGVPVRYWNLPAEMWERKPGGRVTHDDLLAFHFALQEPGWLERSLEELQDMERPAR